ncbi:hypothetical protein [Motiliproteus sp. MSK22-1]|uniref:hypothetical protein n=1 Tax=Motiliproteus sp. MSK22-1 TaxID=1897630 RepID=UPI00097651AE|nr:hypothetical protein [Motiliproteus sp. MSK22-1]OMH39754.1 hypothetical protein BGP75_01480 [Motiliproteus sp. MSK22-1]
MNTRLSKRLLSEKEINLSSRYLILFGPDTAEATIIGCLLALVVMVVFWQTYFLPVKWFYEGVM